MTQERLSNLRLGVPGLIILFAAMTVINPGFNWFNSSVWADLGIALIPVVVLGAIYRIFRIRKGVMDKALREVNTNIERRILAICVPLSVPDTQAQRLREKGALHYVFYRIVDNDKTLSIHAGRVRDNGLLLSSSIDLGILALVSVTFHLFALIIFGKMIYLFWAIIWAIASLIAFFVFLPLLKRTHLELSNGQLDIIAAHNAQAVRTGIAEQVAALPP